MARRTIGPDAAPAALQAAAQADAQRFHGHLPPPEWRPAAPRWPVAGLLLAAGLALGAIVLARPDVVADAPAPSAPVQQATSTPGPPRAHAAVPRAMPALLVGFEHGVWVIRAEAASRLDAALQLARLGGLPLRGDPTLLAGTRALTLDWEGRDPAFAWRAVLGDTVDYTLQCDGPRCQVTLLRRGAGASAGADDDDAPGNLPGAERVEPGDPGAAFH